MLPIDRAIRAAAQMRGVLHRHGVLAVTRQDMLDVCGGHSKADEAIFWWCYAWHSGRDSDLYKIMCSSKYHPMPRNFKEDPEIVLLFTKLDTAFGPLTEYEYQPVRLSEVQEDDVLIAGSHFACLVNRWPCRVYKVAGALGVACSGGVHGVKLLPGSEPYFHPLTEDQEGFVVGFRR